METNNVKILTKDGEEIKLQILISSIIKKIGEKDAIENSKGKLVVSEFIDTLIAKDDPFVKALATLGSETAINALGLLLFVAFQLGVSFGSGSYKLSEKDPE